MCSEILNVSSVAGGKAAFVLDGRYNKFSLLFQSKNFWRNLLVVGNSTYALRIYLNVSIIFLHNLHS